MKHSILGAALLVCVAAAPAAAAPGDPFGGSGDTGCIPSDKLTLTCGKILTSAFGKLVSTVIKCHVIQAGDAFDAGHSSTAIDADEEDCTSAAKAKFDAALVKASASCPAGVVTNAGARRDVFLADTSNPGSLDTVNGVFFCDATSGLSIAEPGGGDQDEGGSIPASEENYKCAVAVAKGASKLLTSIYKCHAKAATLGFKSKPFDTDGCEETPTKGARARFVAAMQKHVDAGICPPCLGDVGPLGTGMLGALDAQNVEIYPCAP